MVRKSVSKTSAAKKSGKSKRTAKKSRRTGAGANYTAVESSEAAKILAKAHLSLQSAAKTPDQRADASIVGLAQQHAEKGDTETVGSLLGKISGWATEKVSTFAKDHQEDFKHLAGHMFVKLIRGG